MSFGGGGGWARGPAGGGDLRQSLGGNSPGGWRGGGNGGHNGGGGGGHINGNNHSVQVRIGGGAGHHDQRRHVRYSRDDVDVHEGSSRRDGKWEFDRDGPRDTNAPWSTGKRRYDDRNYRR